MGCRKSESANHLGKNCPLGVVGDRERTPRGCHV